MTERREQVVQHILERVRSQVYAAGDRLPSEREMGEVLSASRPLVREALQALAWLGAIETRRGSGSVVARDGRNVLRQSFEVMLLLDSTTIEDLFEVREMLEVPAAGLAAERRTPADLASIREILTEMDMCLEDNQRLATLNRQFHLAIARAARNLVLERILDVVLEARATYLSARCLSPQAWPDWGVSHDTHHSIVDAISARNAHAARRAMTMDMEMAAKFWNCVTGRESPG